MILFLEHLNIFAISCGSSLKSSVFVLCAFLLELSSAYFRDSIRQKMAKYLNNPNYNFEKINRASVACGPMVKWAIAQVIRFVDMENFFYVQCRL